MAEPPPPRREIAAVLLAWSTTFVVEVWLGAGAMVRPDPTQLVFEATGMLVLGAAQLVVLRDKPASRFGALRSPWMPGVASLAGTAIVLGPEGALHAALAFLGAVGLSALALRWGRGAGPASSVGIAAVGAVGARWLLLANAAALEANQLKGAVAVSHAEARLLADLGGPLRGGAAAPDPSRRPLVLITVDTLRADHAVRMSSVRRIASTGALFPRASSTSSWTLPAMASVMSGRMPAGHGADARPGGTYQGIDADVPLLAEDLQSHGYATAAFVTNPWLESTLGFSRGFDTFVHANEAFPGRLLLAGMPKGPLPIDSEVVVDRAISWLDDQPGGGWFLWVHLLDPHLPYLGADPTSIAATLVDGDLRSGRLLTEAQREEVKAAYAAEVADADAHLGRLLDALEGRGAFVLLTADHGEEFWDHGGAEHGHSHHGEVVDVALALSEGGPTGGVASLVDVRPTLRAVAGLSPDGIDLRQGVPAARVVGIWGNNYFRLDRSARGAAGRVIVYGTPWNGALVQSFDHPADVLELLPHAAADGPILRAALAVEAPAEGAAADINVEALRALGYVQ